MVHVFEERLKGPLFDSPIFSEYFSGMNMIVADIETTGLSPARSAVILGKRFSFLRIPSERKGNFWYGMQNCSRKRMWRSLSTDRGLIFLF